MNKKIAIFGGTFDPPHIEHINIIKNVMAEFSIDKMIVLPAGSPPHKNSDLTDKAHRFKMAEIAFSQIENVEINDYEIAKEDKSYSYVMLEHFKNLYPADELLFVVGADSLRDISTWAKPQRVVELAKMIVVPRERVFVNVDAMQKKFKTEFLFSKYQGKKVSSTEIKTSLEFGEFSQNVCQNVAEYILRNKLYSRFKKYVDEVRKRISEDRFKHTKNTVIASLELNYRNKLNLDYADIFIASTLHDIAKNISLANAKEQGLCDEKFDSLPHTVLHSYVGAMLAKRLFPELKDEIIDAIKYHTTFREKMTPLEKVVALGDSIEFSRAFSGVEALRKLSFKDIDKGIYAYLEKNVASLQQRNFFVVEDTIKAKQYFKEIIDGRKRNR